MIFLKLFIEFFKTGLFAVGGGMATVPFLYDLSDKTDWFSHGELADMIAVGESTPGPIGVNIATYVGFKTAGVAGSIIATAGLVLPSIIIILMIAKMLQKFRSNKYVDSAFYGLRPCSVGLIAAAGILVVEVALLDTSLYETTGKILDLIKWKGLILAVLIYIASNYVPKVKKFHPIVFILLSAVVGIVFSMAGV